MTVYDELGTKSVIVRVAFALLAGTIPLTHATAPSELEESEGRRPLLIEPAVDTNFSTNDSTMTDVGNTAHRRVLCDSVGASNMAVTSNAVRDGIVVDNALIKGAGTGSRNATVTDAAQPPIMLVLMDWCASSGVCGSRRATKPPPGPRL
jgi:hypothetical protein